MGVKIILLSLMTACTCATALGQSCQTPWQDCGSTGMKINNFSIPGCCSPPCQIQKGKNTSLTVTFTPGSDYSDLTQKLCAMLESACIPAESFFKFPPDVCTLVKNCPFVAGSQYTEMDTIYVSSSFPDVTTIVKWTYYGPDSKMVGCFEVPLQLIG